MSDDIKKKVNRGLAWVGTASSIVAFFDIAAHLIVLNFWVSKEELGIAMYAIALFPALDLMTDLGITAALIQRDDHTPTKVNTVFWLNLVMSLVIFGALALGVGPLLSWIHNRPVVAGLLTLYGAKLIWQNIYFIPSALLQRELRFKELSVVRIFANCAEFAGIIGFAAAGAGVWSFVAGPLCRVLVTGVGVQILKPWRPKFLFNLREGADWLIYGFKTSAHKLLFQFYTNVDYQIVGFFFGDAASGAYTIAYRLVLEPCRVISEVISGIGFPAFAKLKNNREKLIAQLVSFTKLSLVLMLGFIALIVVSTPEILSFFGEEYVSATYAARILCLVGLFRALSFVVPPLLDGLGKPGLIVIYTGVASLVMPLCFVLFSLLIGGPLPTILDPGAGSSLTDYNLSYNSVAIGWAVGYPIAFAVLIAIALRQLNLSVRDYVRPVIGIPICAVVAMGVGVAVRLGLIELVPDLIPGARLIITSTIIVVVFVGLLAQFMGISPRSVRAALK